MNKLALSLFLTVIFAAPAYPQETGVFLNRLRVRYGVTFEIENFNTMCNLLCMSDEYAKSIGLEDAQILKMKPLYLEMEKNNARIREELIDFELKITEIMNNKDFNLDEANNICQQIAQKKVFHKLQILKYIKEIRSILTNEQFEALNIRVSIYSGKNVKEKLISDKTCDVIYSQK